jgi:hypothetical protein
MALVLLVIRPAEAHTRVELGPYVVILGWEKEPVVVGERNALLLEVTEDEEPVEGLESTLSFVVLYGGQTFTGNLNPTTTPGLYSAEILPTVRGLYAVELSGAIDRPNLDHHRPCPGCYWAWHCCGQFNSVSALIFEAQTKENKMIFTRKQLSKKLLIAFMLVLSLFIFAACSSTGGDEQNMEEMEHDEGEEAMDDGEHEEDEMGEDEHEMEHKDDEHDHEEHMESDRIPNEGAAIRILSPADGATFAATEEIPVSVEVTDFALGEEGKHWHVYIDGSSWGMVVGGRTEESLGGVEPGEHKIEVVLANGAHLELEDGDIIHIVVE